MKIKKLITKTIYLGSGHAGFETKKRVKEFLESEGLKCEDLGAFEYNKNDDYPDWISKVAEKVSENPESTLGIIFGGSGQGEAIVANRYPNVRATVYYGQTGTQIDSKGNEIDIIESMKLHNNSNILSIGVRFIPEGDAEAVVNHWLAQEFSDEERHIRRIEKIEKLKIIKKN